MLRQSQAGCGYASLRTKPPELDVGVNLRSRYDFTMKPEFKMRRQ